jgi:hypothetical protein
MSLGSIGRRTGRALAVGACLLGTVSLISPNTAYARHGNGPAIALGIIGGVLAGAAIASGAQGYYAPAPAYYYPYAYAPPTYSVAPAPAYYYRPPAASYYAPRYYYGGY